METRLCWKRYIAMKSLWLNPSSHLGPPPYPYLSVLPKAKLGLGLAGIGLDSRVRVILCF